MFFLWVEGNERFCVYGERPGNKLNKVQDIIRNLERNPGHDAELLKVGACIPIRSGQVCAKPAGGPDEGGGLLLDNREIPGLVNLHVIPVAQLDQFTLAKGVRDLTKSEVDPGVVDL